MMKKFNLKFFNTAMMIMAFSLLLVSCDKDEPNVKEKAESKMFNQQNVQNVTKWYYFSFAEDKFVGDGEADPTKGDDEKWSKRTDWDIAFHSNNVRTNSGTSGIGKGGIMALKTEDFESVKEVVGNDFIVDEIDPQGIIINDKHKFGPNASINPAANRWVYYNHGVGWEMTKRNVFIVRTADGKYAKIQFINFLNDKDKSKFITMKYAYQKDGTTKFE